MRCDRSLSVAWLASLLVATSIVAPRAMPLREQVWRLPFDHYHGLIFLTARINGSEPLAFAFDSGASLTTINESRAAALKLTLRHAQHVTGADGGEGSIRVAFANGVAFTLFQPRQVFKKDDRDVRLHVKRGEQQLQYRFRRRRRI